jgi:Raf kinase inhibitor-like YbhB/YbcL family protein
MQESALEFSSPCFESGGMMPTRYTCEGFNIAPGLAWSGVPEGTRSLALIMEDRDIPLPKFLVPSWVHWIVYNIPPLMTALPEAFPHGAIADNGIRQGKTSFRRHGYGGPCPPFGTHRYIFTLSALDTVLTLMPQRASKRMVINAMRGHILAQGVLMGWYGRGGQGKEPGDSRDWYVGRTRNLKGLMLRTFKNEKCSLPGFIACSIIADIM